MKLTKVKLFLLLTVVIAAAWAVFSAAAEEEEPPMEKMQGVCHVEHKTIEKKDGVTWKFKNVCEPADYIGISFFCKISYDIECREARRTHREKKSFRLKRNGAEEVIEANGELFCSSERFRVFLNEWNCRPEKE